PASACGKPQLKGARLLTAWRLSPGNVPAGCTVLTECPVPAPCTVLRERTASKALGRFSGIFRLSRRTEGRQLRPAVVSTWSQALRGSVRAALSSQVASAHF